VLMAVTVAVAVVSRTAAPADRPPAAGARPSASAGAATPTADQSAAGAAEATVPAGPSIAAYRGLGSWVDIYDTAAWRDPASAVADMARHNVRTLYLETGNSGSKTVLTEPAALAEFIREAHAHGMLIVAWYLADMRSEAKDLARVTAAIRFTTTDGQSFDSFALDIESGAVTPVAARNAALERLSLEIREIVGPRYPLGAIIPSPVGLAKKGSYWPAFPYTMLARTYDVFVPMSYYTYHGKGGAAAYADTIGNVRILRAQEGCSTAPIHLIGGIAENSSAFEVAEFVRAAREAGCIGASLYGWVGTTAGHWRGLQTVVP
jgi:hypothetical protein